MTNKDGEQLRALYTEMLAPRAVSSRRHCVSADRLLAVASGHATPAERLVVLEHVAVCHECGSELGLLRAVTADWPVQRKRASRRLLTIPIVTIVVLASAIVLWHASCAAAD